MRWLTIAVALVALSLVGAGCGGDDESTGDTDTIVETDTTATDETTTEDPTDETTTDDTTTDETDGSGSFASGDCLKAVTAFTALSQAVATAGSSGRDAEDSARAFQEFANDAPEEIRDDIQVLGDAYAEYISVLTGLGLDAGDAPSADQIQEVTEASEKLNTPEVLAASESFSTWAEENCPSG